VYRSFYYLLIGLFLWVAMVKSGIHGTLCGVVLAMALPVEKNGKINPSFHGLEQVLRPLVFFIILPIFSFVNSGISLHDFDSSVLASPLSLGIIFGLFIGKQLGIFLFSYGAVRMGYCSLPQNVSWAKFYGVGVLGGIGFTLSLFIGDLTFETADLNYKMRVGVILGSFLSAIFGVIILLCVKARRSLHVQ